MPGYFCLSSSNCLINTSESISLTSVAPFPHGVFLNIAESSAVQRLLMWVPAVGVEVASYHRVPRRFGVVSPSGICVSSQDPCVRLSLSKKELKLLFNKNLGRSS